ncbi:Extradiol ring-cleavage dioxygenase class III enzyme subunit B [Cylindrobasidium torrendii FP15055 ss-10]|uniref:Extradiol ring-cleavage dioxygenase class III enzyme subunit B n=1 Tax=Cylindrobasidium torrendii FP15055 ss-10 TaxID=1314674 RepID=A0A0D7AY13_9AGAR|nr:Extradiol ring-cleavage dioxygenase class III enzyme subunit B [Cylindrobasidium torrendii FP15055 ss-10]
MSSSTATIPMNQEEWRAAIDALPANPEKIPAFFFSHGSPMLAMSESDARAMGSPALTEWMGPTSQLAKFLKDFGPALLKKYSPKAIVVFSAHWETQGERIVSDYGDENPLLMDYYGFQPEMYKLKFKSKGDASLSKHIVELYKEAGYLSRTTTKLEARGRDGRGFSGPGFDHGVFVPFRLMFGEEFMSTPIVEVSLDSSLKPEDNWRLGQVVSQLREESILVLSGGLLVHNLRDFNSMSPDTAKPILKEFHSAVIEAFKVSNPEGRKQALYDLVKHRGFREAAPREEHFVPLYIAAGAAEKGEVKVLNGLYGIPTVAFGV